MLVKLAMVSQAFTCCGRFFQSDCTREKGVEMGVDRGLGDLEITCVVSCRSADGGKFIEWDLDGLGVGF